MQELGQKCHNNIQNPRTRLKQSSKIPIAKWFKLAQLTSL